MADKSMLQNVATEAFLRGCRHKEAAITVFNEGPTNIQIACQRINTLIANKKAVYGSRVTFQERQFTLEEERRVSDLEKSVNTLMMMRGSPSPSRRYTSGSNDLGYWADHKYNMETRGRTAARSPHPFQNRTGYSPSPNRGYGYGRPLSPQTYNYFGQNPQTSYNYPVQPQVPWSPYQYNNPYNQGSLSPHRGYPNNRYPPINNRYTPYPDSSRENLKPTYSGHTQRGSYPQGRGYPNYAPDIGQPRSPSPRREGFASQRSGYSPRPSGQEYNRKYNRETFRGNRSPSYRSPGPKPPDPSTQSPVPDRQPALNTKGLSM